MCNLMVKDVKVPLDQHIPVVPSEAFVRISDTGDRIHRGVFLFTSQKSGIPVLTHAQSVVS